MQTISAKVALLLVVEWRIEAMMLAVGLNRCAAASQALD
jgi:hypothetical protein